MTPHHSPAFDEKSLVKSIGAVAAMQQQSINDVKYPNARPVFKALGPKNSKTLKELEEATKLSPGMVLTAIRELSSAGLIVRGPPRRLGVRGRPAVTYLKAPPPETPVAQAPEAAPANQ